MKKTKILNKLLKRHYTNNNDVFIETHVYKSPYTYVCVIEKGKKPAVGVGFSKACPKDLPNKELGFTLALSRAIQDLQENS